MLTITDTMASHTRLARPFLAVDQHGRGSLNGRGELDRGGCSVACNPFCSMAIVAGDSGVMRGQGKSVDRLESVSEHGVAYFNERYHGVASSIVRRPRGLT